jgi:hypothetical protein
MAIAQFDPPHKIPDSPNSSGTDSSEPEAQYQRKRRQPAKNLTPTLTTSLVVAIVRPDHTILRCDAVTDLDEFMLRLESVDCEPLVRRLVDLSGGNCSELQARTTLGWYKKFLFLAHAYPHISLSVSKEIDELWHLHILDTKKYAADCQHLFGYFLHHVPQDPFPEQRREMQETTRKLFVKHFGPTSEGLLRSEELSNCGRCSSCSNDIAGSRHAVVSQHATPSH